MKAKRGYVKGAKWRPGRFGLRIFAVPVRFLTVGVLAIAMSLAGAAVSNADEGQPVGESQSTESSPTTGSESPDSILAVTIDSCLANHYACGWMYTSWAGSDVWYTPNVGNYTPPPAEYQNIESVANGRAAGKTYFRESAASSNGTCVPAGIAYSNMNADNMANKTTYIQVSDLIICN